MNEMLLLMMRKHPPCNDASAAKNVIKQILQEIILCGLSRSDFYTFAAFNGGTALRVFHNLPRFSEDLDFSVDDGKIDAFDLNDYASGIDTELGSLGIPAAFEIDSQGGFVKRAYVKGNCREVFSAFGIEESICRSVASNEVLKVKIEADTSGVYWGKFETRFLLQPYPAPVRMYDSASLFAGKVAAVLTRRWKTRVKGRDLYDYLFYVSNNYPINMKRLEMQLKFSEAIDADVSLDTALLKKLLIDKFKTIDYSSAKEDVIQFISDTRSIDVWSPELFISITENYGFKEETC